MRKIIYNPDSNEVYHKIVGGKPTGIANFSNPSRTIYKNIYEGMLDRTWFPSQVDLSDDAKAISKLTDAEVRFYELTFGKLIFDDSVVTNRIMDNFNQYITDAIANACLARQAFEESLHSQSYSFVGDDILKKANGDGQKIYTLYKTDKKLLQLTNEINEDYKKFDDGSEVTPAILALGSVANIALEGISFPMGFLSVWSLGETMRGSASMITEISKDELGSHLPLYINFYNHIIEDCRLPKKEIDIQARKMLIRATEREISFLKYSSEGVLGYFDKNVENFAHWICDSRLRELGMEEEYKNIDTSEGLIKIYRNYSQLNETKTNFFEGTVKTYSKKSLEFDDDF